VQGSLKIRFSDRFLQDYKRLPPDIQVASDECLKAFSQDPLPPGRRPHSVSAKGERPKVFSMDVLANKSWKLTWHLEDGVAVLRRVDTHKAIDRKP
jgi:hypothetical protein